MAREILMPALTPTMEEGTLARWHVRPGDSVKPGQVIAEIETDKSVLDLEALEGGRDRRTDGARRAPRAWPWTA